MRLGGGSEAKEKKLEKRIEKAKRPHSTYQDALIVGVALCIIAGLLFALSAAVSWADLKIPDGFDHRYIMDLGNVSANFAFLWIIPFGGIALAVSSVAQLSRTIVESRWKQEVSVVTLVLAAGLVQGLFIVVGADDRGLVHRGQRAQGHLGHALEDGHEHDQSRPFDTSAFAEEEDDAAVIFFDHL